MPLGANDVHKAIADWVVSELSDSFRYEQPLLLMDTSTATCSINLGVNDLGRMNWGLPSIRLVSVDNIVTPILEKFNIHISYGRRILHSGINNSLQIGTIKADSEDEVKKALIDLTQYISEVALPFWNKYKHLTAVAKLATELDDLLTHFCDEVDFNVLTILSLTNSRIYETKKLEFKQNQILLAEHSDKYKNYPLAFDALIEKLENG